MLASLLGISMLLQGPSPDAVCVDLKGNSIVPVNKSAKPAPKATVLIFYLAHCPISQKMTPEINRLYKEFTPRGVKFYMVHEDLTLTNAEVAQEAKSFELLPPVVVDKWRTQMKQVGATISPEAVVFDSSFKMRYRGRINDLFYGLGKMRPKATKSDLRDSIASVLAGKNPPPQYTEAVGCVLPKG